MAGGRSKPARQNRHLPTVLVGDMNSDTKTVVQSGGDRAYDALVKGGMRERNTYEPRGRCLKTSLLPVADGAPRAGSTTRSITS